MQSKKLHNVCESELYKVKRKRRIKNLATKLEEPERFIGKLKLLKGSVWKERVGASSSKGNWAMPAGGNVGIWTFTMETNASCSAHVKTNMLQKEECLWVSRGRFAGMTDVSAPVLQSREKQQTSEHSWKVYVEICSLLLVQDEWN